MSTLRPHIIAVAAFAMSLAACSGNFSSGTSMPGNPVPPVGPSNPPPYGANGIPQNEPVSGAPSATPSPQFSLGTFALTDAASGFACPPTSDGYACTIRFNMPPSTPSPKPGSKAAANKATATPSPTPSPTPTPTPTPVPSPLASGSANPSASPSPPAVPTISLKAKALPKDAPPMYHTPPNTLDVVPLMMVELTPNADFALNGPAQASFTLPEEQLGQRGFAVQLFHKSTSKKHVSYTPVWTFDKSHLDDGTLTFDFTASKLTIPKDTTYVLVLYGDDRSKSPPATSSPSASPPPSPAATATP